MSNPRAKADALVKEYIEDNRRIVDHESARFITSGEYLAPDGDFLYFMSKLPAADRPYIRDQITMRLEALARQVLGRSEAENSLRQAIEEEEAVTQSRINDYRINDNERWNTRFRGGRAARPRGFISPMAMRYTQHQDERLQKRIAALRADFAAGKFDEDEDKDKDDFDFTDSDSQGDSDEDEDEDPLGLGLGLLGDEDEDEDSLPARIPTPQAPIKMPSDQRDLTQMAMLFAYEGSLVPDDHKSARYITSGDYIRDPEGDFTHFLMGLAPLTTNQRLMTRLRGMITATLEARAREVLSQSEAENERDRLQGIRRAAEERVEDEDEDDDILLGFGLPMEDEVDDIDDVLELSLMDDDDDDDAFLDAPRPRRLRRVSRRPQVPWTPTQVMQNRLRRQQASVRFWAQRALAGPSPPDLRRRVWEAQQRAEGRQWKQAHPRGGPAPDPRRRVLEPQQRAEVRQWNAMMQRQARARELLGITPGHLGEATVYGPSPFPPPPPRFRQRTRAIPRRPPRFNPIVARARENKFGPIPEGLREAQRQMTAARRAVRGPPRRRR